MSELIKLKSQLYFPLYAASRAIVKLYNHRLEEFGLTYTQYIALKVLWERKTINVKTLGEFLFLDSGTLTPVLKKLEKMNLLKRKRSKKDERNLDIILTDKGNGLRETLKALPEEIAANTGLNEDEQKLMYVLLTKILTETVNK